jgi:exodeoxyribonuclease VII large subunit
MIPNKSFETSKDNPWPLATYSKLFAGYVNLAPPAWIEAQIVSNKIYNGRSAYLKLKDLNEEAYLPASSFSGYIIKQLRDFQEGAQVILKAKPNFWSKRGEISMNILEIAEVGSGALLQKLDELKRKLANEGLFDQNIKTELPFLPRKIGLICGKNAQAKYDVIENVNRRWPVDFDIKEVSVGNSPKTTAEVLDAAKKLDLDPSIDIIVIARGGGALEEVVLPFSEENLIRGIAKIETPIVSAIGHETDIPLLNFVADFAASTPTDAAKNIVPDLMEEKEIISNLIFSLSNRASKRLILERALLDKLISSSVMKSPVSILEPHRIQIDNNKQRMNFDLQNIINREKNIISNLSGKIKTLSFESTFKRGWSIAVDSKGKPLVSIKQVSKNDQITTHLLDGDISSIFNGNFVKKENNGKH